MSEGDAAGPHPLRYHARLAATNCYVYGGEPAKSFDTFYWCVAEYDRDPAAHEETRLNLLWQFKATVTGLLMFPDRPLEEIEDLLANMARRWAARGGQPHPGHSPRPQGAPAPASRRATRTDGRTGGCVATRPHCWRSASMSGSAPSPATWSGAWNWSSGTCPGSNRPPRPSPS